MESSSEDPGFFKVSKGRTTECEKTKLLSEKRRREWLARISRPGTPTSTECVQNIFYRLLPCKKARPDHKEIVDVAHVDTRPNIGTDQPLAGVELEWVEAAEFELLRISLSVGVA
ncbi:hypothetical protein HPB52_015871 [Rhipicephalus sanguineus]|uniref:Uncharacterized protein n=1 Tax=Rhipicephalus sanguineus TaxID=34632 RepID=A0A9D4QBD8_RHISA|nr:hypothetical protein HPB52_015871 [Rhipicephalus sanguineus]